MIKSLIAALVLAIAASGQVRLAQPKPVVLKIELYYERDMSRVRDAQVELMDAVGGSSAMDKQQVNQDGEISFNTYTGVHRMRVTGPEIKTWEGEIDIAPNEVTHMERVLLEPRIKSDDSTAGGPDTVSTVRLNVPKEARKQYEKGLKALQKQDWATARSSFEAATRAYDSYDVAFNGLGVAEEHLGDRRAAQSSFARAIAVNPQYAEALRNLARTYLADNKFAEAAPLLTRSLSIEPVNGWAALSLAVADLKTGNYADAVTYGRKVHNLPGEDSAGHYIAACALDALGKRDDAIHEFETYLQESPQGPYAQLAHQYLDKSAAVR